MPFADQDKCLSPSHLNTQQVGIDRGDIPDLSQVRLYFSAINSKGNNIYLVCAACRFNCSMRSLVFANPCCLNQTHNPAVLICDCYANLISLCTAKSFRKHPQYGSRCRVFRFRLLIKMQWFQHCSMVMRCHHKMMPTPLPQQAVPQPSVCSAFCMLLMAKCLALLALFLLFSSTKHMQP